MYICLFMISDLFLSVLVALNSFKDVTAERDI